ncbi:MAG: DNA gyrase inhibitor YacG [Deltaproteobacteria bacterium]|nr:DNA gyrase inhibitor YacG [Deltaproteobacteria bacterium]
MALVVKCPTCRKEVSWEGNPCRPFCSERCRTIDLGAWTEERFKIPGDDDDLDALLSELDDDDDEAR